MGRAIATRLLECEHALQVYDNHEENVSVLVDKGAAACASAAEAADDADCVILSVNTVTNVREAVFGNDGVDKRASARMLIIDMSSIDPESTKTIAVDAAEKGLRWLDCPLSGGAPKALSGQLTVVFGGSHSDFDDSKAVMDDLCANFTLMGPNGAGQTTELINQVLCALHFVAVAEATQLALDNGVDAAAIPAALKGGRADSAILQEFMAKMAAKDYTPTGRLDNKVEDLNGVQDLARASGTAMPLTAVCAEIHRLLVSAGHGSADNAVLMKYFEGPQ